MAFFLLVRSFFRADQSTKPPCIFNSISCAPIGGWQNCNKIHPEMDWYFQKTFFWGTWEDLFGQNYYFKIVFSKFSVIVWQGQFCCISQIQTKRVGAWLLWFFFIMKHIFKVFSFNFTKSSRKEIFFCWCHTITLGTDLRSFPLVWPQRDRMPTQNMMLLMLLI